MLFFECYHTYYNKNYMNFISYFFFLTVFRNFYMFLKIIPLSDVAKSLDDNLILVMAFLLSKLCKFRYLSFLKISFVCEKKAIFFIFVSVKESLDKQFLAPFWKNICLFLYSFLSISLFNTLNTFKMRLGIP